MNAVLDAVMGLQITMMKEGYYARFEITLKKDDWFRLSSSLDREMLVTHQEVFRSRELLINGPGGEISIRAETR